MGFYGFPCVGLTFDLGLKKKTSKCSTQGVRGKEQRVPFI